MKIYYTFQCLTKGGEMRKGSTFLTFRSLVEKLNPKIHTTGIMSTDKQVYHT